MAITHRKKGKMKTMECVKGRSQVNIARATWEEKRSGCILSLKTKQELRK